MKESKTDILLHPVRLRIIMCLAARPRLTPQQIGRILSDVPQATLYRHIRTLSDAGIIEVVEERPTGGATERVYALADQAGYLTEDDMKHATKDDHMQYFMMFCANLLRLFGSYLHHTEEISFARDRVGYHTRMMHLTDDEFVAFVTDLQNVLARYITNEARPDRKPLTFSSVLIPDTTPNID